MSFVAGVQMKVLNVHEIKTNLYSILAQIETQGEKSTICRNGKPIADLVPHQKKNRLELHPLLSHVKVNCDSERWYYEVLNEHNLTEILLSGKIAIASTQLPAIHKDPCDRFIIANRQIRESLSCYCRPHVLKI